MVGALDLSGGFLAGCMSQISNKSSSSTSTCWASDPDTPLRARRLGVCERLTPRLGPREVAREVDEPVEAPLRPRDLERVLLLVSRPVLPVPKVLLLPARLVVRPVLPVPHVPFLEDLALKTVVLVGRPEPQVGREVLLDRLPLRDVPGLLGL